MDAITSLWALPCGLFAFALARTIVDREPPPLSDRGRLGLRLFFGLQFIASIAVIDLYPFGPAGVSPIALFVIGILTAALLEVVMRLMFVDPDWGDEQKR